MSPITVGTRSERSDTIGKARSSDGVGRDVDRPAMPRYVYGFVLKHSAT